jgi:hypothetical protein
MIERISIILLLNILFYLKTMSFKYVSDDIGASQRPKHPNKWVQRFLIFEGDARSRPDIDHITTTLIHAFVCVFLYIGFGSSDISFLAAILFSVNPITNQGSVWISGRGYALSTLFLTMALSMPILSPLFLIGATYYPAGFLSPVLLIGSPTPWVVLFLPLAWLFHVKRFKKVVISKITNEMFDEDKKIKPEKLILFVKTFGFYLTHSLIPIRTTFYHSFLQSSAGNDIMRGRAYSFCRFFWIGLASIIGIVTYWILTPWTMVSFGLLWWCVAIAPLCNMFRISQEIAERYAYLPSVGLMVVLSAVIINNPYAVGLWVGMYATKMWFWMDAYQDDYYLIENSRLVAPDAWFAWHIAGMKRFETQSYREAIILWTMASMISPKELKILVNIATLLKISGHPKEAEEYIKKAEANIPAGQEKEAGGIIEDWKKGKMAILI